MDENQQREEGVTRVLPEHQQRALPHRGRLRHVQPGRDQPAPGGEADEAAQTEDGEREVRAVDGEGGGDDGEAARGQEGGGKGHGGRSQAKAEDAAGMIMSVVPDMNLYKVPNMYH